MTDVAKLQFEEVGGNIDRKNYFGLADMRVGTEILATFDSKLVRNKEGQKLPSETYFLTLLNDITIDKRLFEDPKNKRKQTGVEERSYKAGDRIGLNSSSKLYYRMQDAEPVKGDTLSVVYAGMAVSKNGNDIHNVQLKIARTGQPPAADLPRKELE